MSEERSVLNNCVPKFCSPAGLCDKVHKKISSVPASGTDSVIQIFGNAGFATEPDPGNKLVLLLCTMVSFSSTKAS